ncbi:MAG: hypothetical protein HN356_15665 [Calditrichaeota bacterium]|nr:hypothetical protein [Calditrichota bacterium]
MADEGHEHGQYLTDEAMVEKVYSYLASDKLDSAVAYLKGLGDDNIVVNKWVGVQCDINNVKKDPRLSAMIGQAGVDYCIGKDYKLPAAMMLHNISAFFLPKFDEGVLAEDIPTILEAAKQQVILRREIKQDDPLMWALWDEGVAQLAAGNAVDAIVQLEEGVSIAQQKKDKNGEAWCCIFIGKAKYKYTPSQKEEGRKEMLAAARVLMDGGEDWEKESAVEILESVGLKLD